MQLDGYIEKKITRQRQECVNYIRTYLPYLSLSNNGSLAKEAHYHLQAVQLNRQWKRDCAAAACVFVAMRTHDHDVSIKGLAQRLGVDQFEVNRVVNDLRRSNGSMVKAGGELNTEATVIEVLRGAKFYARDGSELEKVGICAKVVEFVDLMRRTPKSNIIMSKELVVASAFIVYKAEAVVWRNKMDLETFYSECGIGLRPEVATNVSKCLVVVNKCLRGLVRRLPYLQAETAGQLKQAKLLNYVGDVLQQKEMLLFNERDSIRDVSRKDFLDSNSKSGEEEEEEEILEDEIESYIRTKDEVESLRPLYEKFFERAELDKKSNKRLKGDDKNPNL